VRRSGKTCLVARRDAARYVGSPQITFSKSENCEEIRNENEIPVSRLRYQLLSGSWLALFALGFVCRSGGWRWRNQQQTIQQRLRRIFCRFRAAVAIGHHGVGPNLGGDPTIPIENTVDSVKLAYSLGARVVEVDCSLRKTASLPYSTTII